MVLCVAVGHVFSVGVVILQRSKVCRHLRGSCIAGTQFSQGFRAWARLFRPSGAGPCAGIQRKFTPKYVPLSIVTEAFASFHKPEKKAVPMAEADSVESAAPC